MRQPFEGIKVLDIAWAATGPYQTLILARHGATVVKVESIHHSPADRILAPFKDFKPGVNRSGYMPLYCSSKYSLAFNLDHPKAKGLLRRFIQWADIVTEAFTPGVFEEKWMSSEEIRKINPSVILLHTSMQGHTGPHAQSRGFGFVLTSMSGIANITGWPDRPPTPPLGAFTDIVSPWLGAATLISALNYRRKTGKGLEIDQSQLESTLPFLAPRLLDYQVNKRDERMGNRVQQAAPHGAYPREGQDRWCTICINTEEEWLAFCDAIENPSWAREERFSTLAGRKANEDDLDRLIATWTINFTPQEVMQKLQSSGIPAGVVQIPEEIFDCPQLKARKHWWVTDCMDLGPFPVPGEPFKLSKTPTQNRFGTPRLGEHTEFVCTKIFGMSEEEFDQLVLEGVFE